MLVYPKVYLPDLVQEIKAAAKLRSAEGKAHYLELCDFYHKVTTARFVDYLANRPAINPLTGNPR